ncbi:4-hydroxy-3-methylbut-2-en-1-yl diphosphate synthase [Prevotella sp. KH2C16]|uniref:4-hydroxy-3-methylbut-2-en-1-yl diphosphate synthase n=1 Tax=Prevotella sp. KH2C16 TaxID=1855325 RepID=UPI000B886ACB|nr:4-hydroxy-3-methylbut-2-en-1-yl diphosphate synthase [Prevotella sp. KH2C16]
MIDLFNYQRRKSSIVHIGALDMGGENPVRVQSMTTTNTNDTQASIDQAECIIRAGGELVRLTTQGRREAENMKNICEGLRQDGFNTPLVADVHFNPNVADIAAQYIEKVRINPGNYVDPARKFIKIDYTDEEYAAELRKIEERFVPFLNICKAHHTAIRIGVNHGSLSDRIRNRYGDTPEGIVESCMEFLRICEKENFHDVVISIKSSNTVVMVRSVRLLVEQMEKENMCYPLHLGVTEAGEGEDGRIKSAVGIGALLADGIGDTVRVSLSEEPEEEIPVARHLVNHFNRRAHHVMIPGTASGAFNWTCPTRRPTKVVGDIGGDHVPVVVSSVRKPSDEAFATASKADYLYLGAELPTRFDDGRQYILDFNVYAEHRQELAGKAVYPVFPVSAMPFVSMVKAERKFLVLRFGAPAEEYIACLKAHPEVVVVCMSNHPNRTGEQRALVHEMMNAGLQNPVIFSEMYQIDEKSDFQLDAAADLGALLIDGLADGVWLMNEGKLCPETIEETAFGILQAARLRTSKTEYISCPGCGRTLYDLRETIAKIKAATSDMKGLKIGIMGCIVNGPGEMADADYGYVGAGPGKVSLYRKQVCVEHNIPEEEAVEHLLALIQKDKESL